MEKSSSPSAAESYRLATALLVRGEKQGALALAQSLANEGYEPSRLLLGLILEFGGEGIQPDLLSAIGHYRKLCYSTREPIAYVHLARALMKHGGGDACNEAFSCLSEAKTLGGGVPGALSRPRPLF